jgi:ubiquinone/menaquinone biosynthesis C-methylase UbiE
VTNFDERARDWDTPERRARAVAVADAIRAAVPLSPSTRTIEVGAGTGLLGLALAPAVGELVLAEPSAGMLEVIRDKLRDRGPSRVSALRLDLLTDPPPPEPFDLVISLLVLHHLQDTDAALTAIHRLLRPGGSMALADLDAEDGFFHGADAEGIPHLGFDRDAVSAAAMAAGFEDVEVRTATELERDGRRYPLFLLIGRRGAAQPASGVAR